MNNAKDINEESDDLAAAKQQIHHLQEREQELKQIEAKLREEAGILDILNQFGQTLSAELQLDKVIQAVTKAALDISNAQHGVFCFNENNRSNSISYLEDISFLTAQFSQFPLSKESELIQRTFQGEIVRFCDTTADENYCALMRPLNIASYLAVPIKSQFSGVLGGLFFCHSEPAVFTTTAERIIQGLAHQAAIAIDNACLYQKTQEALEAKEESLKMLKEREILLVVQNRVLKHIAQGGSLKSALELLAQMIESELGNNSKTSILLLDEDGVHVRHGAGPSLPKEYKQLIDGLAIGPNAGSCGTAAYTRKTVIVPDIETNPLWQNYAQMALPFGLRSCWSTPIISSDDRVLGTFAIYRERFYKPTWKDIEFINLLTSVTAIIIERKQIEDKRNSIQEELARTNQLKDEFIAVMSHELRTPLTAILGWVRLIQGGKLDRASISKALTTIERNVKTQSQLIEDLLDITRISNGKLRLNLEPVYLPSIVSAAINNVRLTAEEKNISLRNIIDGNIKMILGDPERLLQIVSNLLTNAIKFTPDNGKVSITLEEQDPHIALKVSDNGKGIAPDFLPHVFDRFAQAANTTPRTRAGLGLGLAIVKNLVDLHNGTIEVFSDGEDRGTTFIIKFSAAPLPLENRPTIKSHTNNHSTDSSRKELIGLKILVVEDQFDTSELLRITFSANGAEVQTANGAAQALEIFDQWTPQVLISDISMPGEDGYQLIKKVRQRAPQQGGNVPAIALTAFARVEDQAKAFSAGFQVHVAKPIEPDELISIVLGVKDLVLSSLE